MIVTKVEPVSKARYKVQIDGQFAFVLYKGELSRYHIAEEEEISEELFHRIRTEVIVKRAKAKAMHLLSDMDRTESQLRGKLKLAGYTEDVAEEAVAYVKSFGYINDEAYARRFVENQKEKKSRRELYASLSQKGLEREMIDTVMEECYGREDSRDAIRRILEKRHYDPKTAEAAETRRILGYLTRKGFHYDDIRQVIQVSDWNA